LGGEGWIFIRYHSNCILERDGDYCNTQSHTLNDMLQISDHPPTPISVLKYLLHYIGILVEKYPHITIPCNFDKVKQCQIFIQST